MSAPFDAVLFDLDGTLVASGDAWIPALRRGVGRAFEQLGLERPPLSNSELSRVVGVELEPALAELLPELDVRALETVLDSIESERAALDYTGSAAWMPGALECLTRLCADGVRLGIASYCGRRSLEFCMGEMGFGEFIDEARCIESPGMESKAQMLTDLCDSFGTRSALMIGDRRGDVDAALEAGLPSLHFCGGFASSDEGRQADGSLHDMARLPERLAARDTALASVAARVVDALGPQATVGVAGLPGAGATLMARDLARAATRADVPARSLHPWSAVEALAAIARGESDFGPRHSLAGLGLAALESTADPGLTFVEAPAVGTLLGQRLDAWIEVRCPRDLRERRLAATRGELEGPRFLREVRAVLEPVLSSTVPSRPPGWSLHGGRPLDPLGSCPAAD